MENIKHILFTTINSYNGANWATFIRAFESWLPLYKDGWLIIVYGDTGDEQGEKLLSDNDIRFISNIERDEFGLPLVRSLFMMTQKLYPNAKTYTYCNSDIIFNSDLNKIVDNISKQKENFLLVGQRIDVFEDGTEQLHNPGGIDYFCYTPNFWNLEEMPNFSIARGRFDHYLLGYALQYGNGDVIDITVDFKVTHPEPKYRMSGDVGVLYHNGNFSRGYQVLRNHYYFAKAKLHGQINYAPYKLNNGDLIKDNTIYFNEFNEKIEKK